MKKGLVLIIWLVIALLASGTAVLAGEYSDAKWRGTIVVSNNSTATSAVSVNMTLNSASMISQGYANSGMTDTLIQYNSVDMAHMSGYDDSPWVFWVPVIGATQSITYSLYTKGATGGKIRYFPDDAGMTVTDDDTIELSDNGTIEFSGFVDTTAGANKFLVQKSEAINVYVSPTTSGNITASIPQTTSGTTVTQALSSQSLPIDSDAADFQAGFEKFENFSGNITRVDWYLKKILLPVGTGYARVRKASDDSIIGTIGTIDVATIGAAAYHTFNTTPVEVQPPQDIYVTFEYAVGDNANYIEHYYQNSDVYDGGIGGYLQNSVWTESPTVDMRFVLYYYAPVSVTATGISSGEKDVTVRIADNEPIYATGDVLHFTDAADSTIDAGAIYNAEPKLWIAGAFKLDSDFTTASPNNMQVFSKRIAPGNNRLDLYLQTGTGKLVWDNRVGGVWAFEMYALDNAGATITSWTAGVYYHFVASISSVNAARLRVDDGNVVTDPDVQAAPNGGNFVLGAGDNAGNFNEFVGNIMNVVVGTDDLSPAEEVALIAGIAPADATEYWYIDEGTGTNVYSYGTTATTGVAAGGATWQTSTFTTGNTGRLCDFTLQVGSERWGTNLKGASVPPNNSDYVFFQNGAMPYVESASIDKAGVPVSAWAWEYDTTFHDSIGSNDATPSFRTASSNADVSAVLSSFSPITEAVSTALSTATYQNILTADITMPPEMYTELDFTNVPGADSVNVLLDDSGTPRALWWFPFMFFGIIIVGFLVYEPTRSLPAQCAVCGSLLVLFGIINVIPFWPAILFCIPAAAIMFSTKHQALG